MMVIPPAAVPVREAIDFTRPMFCLFGLSFDLLPMAEVVDIVGNSIRERRRLVMSTPNVNNIVSAQTDAAFRDAVTRCNLVVPDGMPLVWLARLLGIPARRIAGSDVFDRLQHGSAGSLKVFFFGGPEGIAELASRRLISRSGPMSGAGGLYPGFGSVRDMAAPDVARAINEAKPDFLIVALGTAKGQAWIEEIQTQLTVPMISHLGAVVNFAAGSIQRAPLLMQVSGTEWLWRIWEEPALWRRYAKDARVLLKLVLGSTVPLLLQRFARLFRGHGPAAAAEIQRVGPGLQRLVLRGNWQRADVRRFGEVLNTLTDADGDIEIDASGLGAVDQGIVARLIRLRGLQMTRGSRLSIRAPSATFVRALHLHCASYLIADSARSASGAGLAVAGAAK